MQPEKPGYPPEEREMVARGQEGMGKVGVIVVFAPVKAAVARNLGTLKQLLEGTRPTTERNQA